MVLWRFEVGGKRRLVGSWTQFIWAIEGEGNRQLASVEVFKHSKIEFVEYDASQLAVSIDEVSIKTREIGMEPQGGVCDIGCHDESKNRRKWWSRTKRANGHVGLV